MSLEALHRRLPGWTARRILWRELCRLPGFPQWPRARPFTMVSDDRLRSIEALTRRVIDAGVPGAFVECGVARGGTALLAGLVLKRTNETARGLWLFDTFEGLPPPTADDPDYARAVTWIGKCRGDLAEVTGTLASHGVLPFTRCVQGLFQETMPATALPEIAFLHLDGDWYESTLTCLQHLWPVVSPGGVLQVDDYGAWEGCRKAVDEYFCGAVPLHPIDFAGVWIEKPAHPLKASPRP